MKSTCCCIAVLLYCYTAVAIVLNDVKSCNTIKDLLTIIYAHYSKGVSVNYAIHSLLDGKIMNKSVSESLD